jgi:DNA-binding CsgD family transcriptional regulator
MGVLLSRIDYESALRLVGDAGSGAAYDETVSTLLTRLPRLIGSELTTLSYCDLAQGRRTVVSNPARPALYALTDREREVLEWVARGKTNADIGAILGISTRTVQKHLENVFAKLAVETRTAAVSRLKG